MEFCFSRCYVLPSHKMDASVPRPSLPTATGITVSLAASTIAAPCFYTPERNPSQEIHSVLFLPTESAPKSALSKMISPPRANEAKAGGEGQTRSAASHTRTKKPGLPRQLTTSAKVVFYHYEEI